MESEKPDLIKLVQSLCREHLGFDNEITVVTVYSDLEVISPSNFEAFSSEEFLKESMDKLNQALKNETNQIFKIGGYGCSFPLSEDNDKTVKLTYLTVVPNRI